jgi:succinate-acetate transporter protein
VELRYERNLFRTWQQIARELVKLGGNHMSVSEDRDQVAPGVQSAAVVGPIADPGPLGLAAFATTTFLLMAVNARWTIGNSAGTGYIGYALAYGGGAQLLAGMWEFRNRNVFGATAFSTWGAFWIGLFIWIKNSPAASGHDLAWILIAFAVVNAYLLLFSIQVNLAVFGVFVFLEATLVVLVIGNFTSSVGITQAGGYVGIVTAVFAWYASAAGIGKGLNGRIQLPVGKPLI